ncbi:transposase [Streptomyces kebangsaanensis]|uniref:Transposase n=1 Tax=Streptomyces kebangsaanensis TaxID=864058 RepID=A0ABW6L441_9ACTN
MQLSRCPLSLRPRSGEQIPSLAAQVARASNPDGTAAIWVRDRLDGLWCDEDFVGWYPRDGRPGLSPAQPTTVCVPQFLLGLSDRQAAEAVRCRTDFTYTLAMELDDPGFHHSVPADFRDRLTRGDRARTPRPASPCPQRTADTRVEGPLRGPRRRRPRTRPVRRSADPRSPTAPA